MLTVTLLTAACHGTPGSGEPAIAKGEYPKPPQFASHPQPNSRAAQDHPPGHTFCVIKNGIRLTGMPAWQDRLFIGLARSASDATDFFQIPTGRVVEVGTQVAV